MTSNRYRLSFTAISLMIPESITIAEVYLDVRDWKQVREIVLESNLLQSRTRKRSVRVVGEIIQRISLLTDNQLELLIEGSIEEQRLMMWLAVCKCYEYINEFAVEVIHQKFLAMDHQLTEDDYRTYYNRKVDWHPELEEITESSRKKLQTRLFRMMKESGIVNDDLYIQRIIPSTRLKREIIADPNANYQIYPTLPMDFQG